MSAPSLIAPHQISHGTIECNDMEATRRFLTEFLGLDVVRALREAQYISKGGPWSVVCVQVGKTLKPQSFDNRFELSVASRDEVDEAYRKAVQLQAEYGIREIRAPLQEDGMYSFALQDLNGGWWEISDFTPQDLDALFDAKA